MNEKYIVCFSGGHSSALAAIETVRKHGKENTILLNHNISSHVEHEDIKRFKEDISNYCGIPITYANANDFEKMTPLEVCKKLKIFSAGTGRAFCTYELKTKPFYDWLEINAKKGDHIVYGFDEDEADRIGRRAAIIRAMGYVPEFPLAYCWERTVEGTEDVGIARPATYKIYKHANCIGCLKAGKQHWYAVYCLRPDIFEEAKQAEKEIGYSIIKGAYLQDLESKFHEMKYDKYICPSEKLNAQDFWARVEKIMPGEMTMVPCDCAF